jgi:hypothetical protein
MDMNVGIGEVLLAGENRNIEKKSAPRTFCP